MPYLEVTHPDGAEDRYPVSPSSTLTITETADGTAQTLSLDGLEGLVLVDGDPLVHGKTRTVKGDSATVATTSPGGESSLGGKVIQTGKQVVSTGGKLTLRRDNELPEQGEIEPPTHEPFVAEPEVTASEGKDGPPGVESPVTSVGDAEPQPPAAQLTENQRTSEQSHQAPDLAPSNSPTEPAESAPEPEPKKAAAHKTRTKAK